MSKYSKIYYENGDELSFKDDKLHSLTGPAVKTREGYEIWFKDGSLHREDGPAYIGPCGMIEYWIHGVRFTADAFIVELGNLLKYEKNRNSYYKKTLEIVNALLLKEIKLSTTFKHRAFVVRKTVATFRKKLKEIKSYSLERSQERSVR